MSGGRGTKFQKDIPIKGDLHKARPISLTATLEETFKAYIKDFNPKVPRDKEGFMNIMVWRRFVMNMNMVIGKERQWLGHKAFHTNHDRSGKHVEGEETMDYEDFRKAINFLLEKNEEYCKAKGRELQSQDSILADIISVNKCRTYLEYGLSETVPVAAATLTAMAESSVKSLTNIGSSVHWINPAITLFKEIWDHVKAYKEIGGDIDDFASLLLSVSDTIVYIINNDLYRAENTQKRLKFGLSNILKDSEKVLKKARDNRKNTVRSCVTAENDQRELKKQEQSILNWLNSLQFMQSAEHEATTRKIASYGTTLEDTNARVRNLQESRDRRSDVLQDSLLHEVKEFRAAVKEEHSDINAKVATVLSETGETGKKLSAFMVETKGVVDGLQGKYDDVQGELSTLKVYRHADNRKIDQMNKNQDETDRKVDELKAELAKHTECAQFKERLTKLENMTSGKPLHPDDLVLEGQAVMATPGNRITASHSTEVAELSKLDEEGQESITRFPVRNQYAKIKRLGGGSYGQVFKWQHRANENDFIAVKEIAFEVLTGTTSRTKEEEDIMEEIRKLQGFKHEHIVRYFFHELDDPDNIYYIAMEYMAGGSLKQLMMKKKAKLQEDKVISYTRQILLGVQFLHEQPRPIVHRDIKSANILLNKTEEIVKLADFGIAKELNTYRMKRGLTSERKGTYLYMAPEALAVGDDKDMGYGTKADIWGVGCVVLEMASGKPPWSNISRELDLIDCIREKKETPHVPEDLFGSAKDFLSQTFTWNADERPTAQTLLSHPMLSVQQGELDKDFGQNLTGGDVPKPILELNDIDILSQPENVEDENAFLLKPAAVPANDADGVENVVKCKTVGDPNDIPGQLMQEGEPEKAFLQKRDVPGDNAGGVEAVSKFKTVDDPNDIPGQSGDVTV